MNKQYDNTNVTVKTAVCPVHGDVGNLNWVFINNDKTIKLCLWCMAEKLVELGVQEVEWKERKK